MSNPNPGTTRVTPARSLFAAPSRQLEASSEPEPPSAAPRPSARPTIASVLATPSREQAEPLPLPLNKAQQLAVLGHALDSLEAFTKLKASIGPGDFSNPHVGKLWTVALGIHAEHKRLPTREEIGLGVRDGEIQKACDEALEATREAQRSFPSDAVGKHIEQWAAARAFYKATHQATKHFNAGRFEEAYAVMAKGVTDANAHLDSKDANPVMSLMRGLTADELLKPAPPIDWLLYGHIPVEPGLLCILSGSPGIGKTTLMLDLLVHRALGRPWMKLAIKQGVSVFLSRESTWAQTQRRIRASILALGNDVNPDLIAKNLKVVCVSEAQWKLIEMGQQGHGTINQGAIDDLVAAVKTQAPGCDFIVFETVSRITGDETVEGFKILVEGFEEILRQAGATGMAIHHPNKSDATSVRGGSSLVGNARMVWIAEEKEKLPDNTLEEDRAGKAVSIFEIKLDKRHGEKRPPIAVEGYKVYESAADVLSAGLALRCGTPQEAKKVSEYDRITALVEKVSEAKREGIPLSMKTLNRHYRPEGESESSLTKLVNIAVKAERLVRVERVIPGKKTATAIYIELPPDEAQSQEVANDS